MILSDAAIRSCLEKGELIISPPPPPEHFNTTAVDLRLGSVFKVWDDAKINTPGIDIRIVYDDVRIPNLAPYTKAPHLEADGSFLLAPRQFVIAQTLEKVGFPLASRLSGRVEGRSSLARLGVVVHLTAPTIHADFGGESGSPITLEIINLGPFKIAVMPGVSRICQLIVERVEGEAGDAPKSQFRDQVDPLGGSATS
jgi:dCTP deaminase